MSRIVSRRLLTDLVLATLAPLGFPVGDAGPPARPTTPGDRHAGWNGEPNVPGSFYVPFLVLTPQSAVNTSGPFNDPQADLQQPYSLSAYGISRMQTEQMADTAREGLLALRNQTITLGPDLVKIQQVWFNALGGITRVDSTDPATYGEVDSFTLWLTK